MKQARKKHLKIFFVLIMISMISFSQAKSGLENYNFLSKGQPYTWMPVFHYETTGGMYTEVRYNYEALETFSVYGGWTLKGGHDFQFSTTPMLGISAGNFSGISVADNTEAEWKNIYLSSQLQYSFGSKGSGTDFFFNWSELGYSFSGLFYAGLAIQYTKEKYCQVTDPGFVTGINFRGLTIPLYIFRPFSGREFYILGVNINYTINNRKQDNPRQVRRVKSKMSM
jgi:hypothetical protein